MTRRALQVTTSILALIPVGSGVVGLLGLRDPLYVLYGVVPNVALDSNLRFFSGFWLGGGLAVLWMIPRIEREGALFRAFWGMIFLGGVGRVLSLLDAGPPPPPLLAALLLELAGAPLFVLWQRRIEREARGGPLLPAEERS
jgi:hypothetical protein